MFELVFLVILGTLSDGREVKIADPMFTIEECEGYKRQTIINGTNGVAKGTVKPGFRVECQTVTFTVQQQ